jgi:hypothetical protein
MISFQKIEAKIYISWHRSVYAVKMLYRKFKTPISMGTPKTVLISFLLFKIKGAGIN